MSGAQYIYAPETLIRAYMLGVFPMAESRTDPSINFYAPDIRGILPLNPPHIPRKVGKLARQRRYEVRWNHAFAQVIDACAEINERRQETWINDEIICLFIALHKMGFAHSVEVYDAGKLIGGLYGLAIGGCFFGESMFSRQSNSSKLALVHLIARLKAGGFRLLDAQFSNDHLKQFGLQDIPADDFTPMLKEALATEASLDLSLSEDTVINRLFERPTS